MMAIEVRKCRNGIEALATGEFNLVPGRYEKETWGFYEGRKVTILWDVRGVEHNLPWKVEAVRAYQEARGR